jgi:hypothetical protein
MDTNQDKNLSGASPSISEKPLFPIPAGWRVLQLGEEILKGGSTLYKHAAAWGENPAWCVGEIVHLNDMCFYFRRIEAVEAKPEPSSPKSLEGPALTPDALVDAFLDATVAHERARIASEEEAELLALFYVAREALVARLSRMGEMARLLAQAQRLLPACTCQDDGHGNNRLCESCHVDDEIRRALPQSPASPLTGGV